MSIRITLPPISEGAKRNVAIDFTADLNDDELLTGTVTVTENTTTDLTIANKQVNVAIIDINGVDVAVGKAVMFSVDAANAVAGQLYILDLSVATDSTPAERLDYQLELPCE